jgi:hypothetical protein
MSAQSPFRVIRCRGELQQVKPCAQCPESGSFPGHYDSFEALDAQQNFKPVRLVEARDQSVMGLG